MADISITIDAGKFQSWLKQAPKDVAKALERVIYKVTLNVERLAKIGAPVDTGRLRSSISSSIRPMSATVEPHVTYAVFVENGTRFMKSRPFMRNAAEQVDRMIEQIASEELKDI